MLTKAILIVGTMVTSSISIYYFVSGDKIAAIINLFTTGVFVAGMVVQFRKKT